MSTEPSASSGGFSGPKSGASRPPPRRKESLNMRCCDLVRMWDDLREGGAVPTREEVLAHLRRCVHCQEAYREFEGVAYCLTCLPIVEPPPGLVPKILDHLKTLRPASPDMFAKVASPLGELIVAFRESGITA